MKSAGILSMLVAPALLVFAADTERSRHKSPFSAGSAAQCPKAIQMGSWYNSNGRCTNGAIEAKEINEAYEVLPDAPGH